MRNPVFVHSIGDEAGHLAVSAIRLESCPQARFWGPEWALGYAMAMRELINGLRHLNRGPVIALRFIVSPKRNRFGAGSVEAAFLIGARDTAISTSEESCLGPTEEFLRGLRAVFPDHRWRGVSEPSEFSYLWEPFELRSSALATIDRELREVAIERPPGVPGFGVGESRTSAQPEPSIRFSSPISPQRLPLEPLLRLLIQESEPILWQISLEPARLQASDLRKITEENSRVERILHSTTAESIDVLHSLEEAKVELASLLAVLSAGGLYLRTIVASPSRLSRSVLNRVADQVLGDRANRTGQRMTGHRVEASNKVDSPQHTETLAALRLNNAPGVSGDVWEQLPRWLTKDEAELVWPIPIASTDGLPGMEVDRVRVRSLPRLLATSQGSENSDQRPLGINSYLGLSQAVHLSEIDRGQHVWITGSTGVGKTTLITSMIAADIAADKGIGVVDPHGELFEQVLSCIPRSRRDDVIVLDPTDMDFPAGLNLLECRSDDERHFVVREMRGILESLMKDQYGGEANVYAGPIFFQHMQMNMLLAMSRPDEPGTLLDFYDIFQSKDGWQRWLPLQWQDPLLLRWVQNILPSLDYTRRNNDGWTWGEYLCSKFHDFVFDPKLRLIFGQRHSTIDVDEIMNTGKILLVNLAKGQLAETNARFLGMTLMAKLQAAAMRRIRRPASERLPWRLYVDEFQSLATTNFVTLLSEARKFGIELVLANQLLSQIEDRRIRQAILGNVGTMICFRVGSEDAEILETRLAPAFDRWDLVNLPNWTAAVRTTVRGQLVTPFTLETVRPAKVSDCVPADELRYLSRLEYGTSVRECFPALWSDDGNDDDEAIA